MYQPNHHREVRLEVQHDLIEAHPDMAAVVRRYGNLEG